MYKRKIYCTCLFVCHLTEMFVCIQYDWNKNSSNILKCNFDIKSTRLAWICHASFEYLAPFLVLVWENPDILQDVISSNLKDPNTSIYLMIHLKDQNARSVCLHFSSILYSVFLLSSILVFLFAFISLFVCYFHFLSNLTFSFFFLFSLLFIKRSVKKESEIKIAHLYLLKSFCASCNFALANAVLRFDKPIYWSRRDKQTNRPTEFPGVRVKLLLEEQNTLSKRQKWYRQIL